jgi:hypothetical protein
MERVLFGIGQLAGLVIFIVAVIFAVRAYFD